MATIKIIADKCKGCNLCIKACPKNVLAVSKDFNKSGYHPATVADQDKCTGCGFCYYVCPDVCIEVHK